MPTAAERQAIAFLAGVALLGGGVRAWQQRHVTAPATSAFEAGGESVDGQLTAIDGARKAKRARKSNTRANARAKNDSSIASSNKRRASNSSRRKEQSNASIGLIDVDIATAEQLEQLPRIGASLANRIVANRDSFGAFGSLEALGSVRGIGDAMLKSLDPLITFSGRPRIPVAANTPANARQRKKNR